MIYSIQEIIEQFDILTEGFEHSSIVFKSTIDANKRLIIQIRNLIDTLIDLDLDFLKKHDTVETEIIEVILLKSDSTTNQLITQSLSELIGSNPTNSSLMLDKEWIQEFYGK